MRPNQPSAAHPLAFSVGKMDADKNIDFFWQAPHPSVPDSAQSASPPPPACRHQKKRIKGCGGCAFYHHSLHYQRDLHTPAGFVDFCQGHNIHAYLMCGKRPCSQLRRHHGHHHKAGAQQYLLDKNNFYPSCTFFWADGFTACTLTSRRQSESACRLCA